MKKVSVLSVLFICLLASAQVVTAQIKKQSLSDLLKSESVSKVVDKITNAGVDFDGIQGTWTYKEPACELISSDLLAKAGSALLNNQVEKQLSGVCEKVGLSPDVFSYTLNSDSTFKSVFKEKEIIGTYSFDESVQTIAFSQEKLGKITSFKANVKKDGDDLLLLFDADKLLNLINMISEKSDNASLQLISNLTKQYSGVKLGFKLAKSE